MLPDRKKNLIIWIVSIIGVIIVIFLMYNLAKFMHNRSGNVVVADDTYPADYSYYGISVDEDNNYQLTGLNLDYDETILGLRSFYYIDKLYYFSDHLVLYSDAINQVNYDKNNNTFSFYEINSFYSNQIDVLITDNYYIFIAPTEIYYSSKNDLNNTKSITNTLVSDVALIQENSLYYEQEDGIYVYNFEEESSNLLVADVANVELVDIADNYLLYMMDNQLWAYSLRRQNTINVGQKISDEESKAFTYVALVPDYLLYEVEDQEGNNVLKKYSFALNMPLKAEMDLQNETIMNAFYIEENRLYIELVKEDLVRYLIVDYNTNSIVKELENKYTVILPIGDDESED